MNVNYLQFLKSWPLKLLIQENGVVLYLLFYLKRPRKFNTCTSVVQQDFTYFYLHKLKALYTINTDFSVLLGS